MNWGHELLAEVDAYIARFAAGRAGNGRRMVARNGRHQSRKVLFGAGAIEVRAPMVSGRRTGPAAGERQRFCPAILPPWARKTPEVTGTLLLLCPHGLPGGDFVPALGQFPGSSAGLPPAVITKLTGPGKAGQRAFAARDLAGVPAYHLTCRGRYTQTCRGLGA